MRRRSMGFGAHSADEQSSSVGDKITRRKSHRGGTSSSRGGPSYPESGIGSYADNSTSMSDINSDEIEVVDTRFDDDGNRISSQGAQQSVSGSSLFGFVWI